MTQHATGGTRQCDQNCSLQLSYSLIHSGNSKDPSLNQIPNSSKQPVSEWMAQNFFHLMTPKATAALTTLNAQTCFWWIQSQWIKFFYNFKGIFGGFAQLCSLCKYKQVYLSKVMSNSSNLHNWTKYKFYRWSKEIVQILAWYSVLNKNHWLLVGLSKYR